MSDACKTVKIMPSDASQGDYVEINEEDFDKAIHKPYVEPKAPAAKSDDAKA